jgi:DNA-binding response OmpR family regulator
MAVSKPCKILVVEDDPGIQELFRTVLRDEGFDVSLARDGASMRSAFAADRVDVVVLDVGLPGGEDGIALAREAAAGGRGIILITGYHDLREAVVNSGHRYLLKPFRVEALLEAIEQIIDATEAGCIVPRRRRRK